MLRSVLLIFCFTCFYSAVAQKKEIKERIDKLSDKYFEDTSSKPNYLIYPSIAYTPETNFELGVINVCLFYVKNDKRNRLSEVNTFTFYTLEQQYGVWFDHAIYSDKDKWFFLGKGKFQYFPLKYYGIGNQTYEKDYTIINSNSFQLRERVLRNVKGHFFVGLEFDHQNLYNVSYEENHLVNTTKRPVGIDGSLNTALGIGLVYDDRKNVMNTRNGVFGEVAYLNYAKAFGSHHDFHSVQFDGRYLMKGFAKDQVFGIHANGAFNIGNVPFNQLALMGGENMMRGYYTGRYRDKTLLSLQAEYRFLPFPFSKRFGGALFAACGTVAPSLSDIQLKYTRPAVGFGGRYLVFRAKDIYLRLDVAFTEEGNGYYFFIGEAF